MDPQADQAELDRLARTTGTAPLPLSDPNLTATEGAVRLVATLSKGKRATIAAYLNGADTAAAMDVIDAASASGRERFIKQLPDELRDVAGRLLLVLAARIAAYPVIGTSATDTPAGKVLVMETTPSDTPVVLADVLNKTRAHVRRFAIMPSHADVVITLWVCMTHFLGVVHYFGILHVTSATRESGKTRVLELVHLLSARAWSLVSPTLATLFRTIEKLTPTVIIDEVDTISREKLSDFTALLNDGVRPGGCIPRAQESAHGGHEVATYAIYCPKAIGSIGVSLSEATVSRTIRLTMQRATADELRRLAPFRMDRAERWAAPLRAMMARSAIDDGPRLAAVLTNDDDDTAVPLPAGVDGRQAQIWEPLIALADVAGGEWPTLARAACTAFVAGLREAESVDPRQRILSDVRDYFATTTTSCVTSETLITWLTADESRGWQGYAKGKPLTPHALARLLKPFGLRPTQQRAAALPDGRARAWMRADFAPIWTRYLPDENSSIPSVANGTSDPSGTSETTATRTPRPPVTLVPDVPHVTLVPDGSEKEKVAGMVLVTLLDRSTYTTTAGDRDLVLNAQFIAKIEPLAA